MPGPIKSASLWRFFDQKQTMRGLAFAVKTQSIYNCRMNTGHRFRHWIPHHRQMPASLNDVANIVKAAREFTAVDQLDYGDHGLLEVLDTVSTAIEQNKRIALYADYDVDGTMSCVSWIWFFNAIGYRNFVHYIPCRFKEGYGVNLAAIQHLVDQEKADVVITMDTGITANMEAEWCRQRGVTFICTDHHKVQPDKMPDCLILNPKLHPDPNYQELCGCGITFVLLRKLAQHLQHYKIDNHVWTDILALTGMATICDVVPLNGVNHKLAKMGIEALMRSKRPILAKLRQATQITTTDEKDVGFKLGPRINAVGRLEHAHVVINAFLNEDPTDLIAYMNSANERRRMIQSTIVDEAQTKAQSLLSEPIVFLGGDWHPGVVGIAASKIAETHWKPTWLFQRKDGICKGSARSIRGFDVTAAMLSCSDLFTKCGGHAAAGGFSFEEKNEDAIRQRLSAFALEARRQQPKIWESAISYDCALPDHLINLNILDTLETLKPFGHSFEEPKFRLSGKISRVDYYNDKQTGQKKHTCIYLRVGAEDHKILFFNDVLSELTQNLQYSFIVSLSRNSFRGKTTLTINGYDWAQEPQ
jgi:single-stranded-DNA-specific exonuclease